MANSAPLDSNVPPKNSSSAEETKPVEPPFEEKLHQFWKNNARSVYFLCAVVALAIIGRGGYDYYQHQHEADIESSYAAANNPTAMKNFINDHPDHPLAGAGALGLADAAYSAHNYTEAIANYQRAADILQTGPFAGRARIGAAVSKLESGDRAGAEDALKKLADDTKQLKPVRAEANYHLATMAVAAGHPDEAVKYLDQVNALDPTGLWSQKAMMLRTTLPAPAVPTVSAPEVKVAPAKP